MKDKILKIAYGGILSAVVMLATALIKFPMPSGYGYVNFGDGAIFATAAIMGPFAAICAGLGSVLADLIAGYAIYIPATFVIKGTMGLLSGIFLSRQPRLAWYWTVVLFIVCEIIMVGGYYVYEILTYGLAAATGNLIFNTVQGVAGIVLGLVIVPLARRIKSVIKV